MQQQSHKQPTILITGSTGYVCKFLVDKLLKETNFNIVVTYRNKKGNYKENSRLHFEKADLLKPGSFENIFRTYKPAHVIHLASMARVSDGENNPEKVITVNYVASIILAELSIKYGLKSMVFTSSNLAQDAVSVVGIGKFLIEQYFQKLNSKTTKFISLRMPNVIDSNGAVTLIFKKQIKNNQNITITHPDMSRMFVTGERAAELLAYLIVNGINKGVYVSYDKPVKIIDLANIMIKESGKEIVVDIIGMKPGEKLVEKTFSKDEIIKTDIQGLGKIKNYKYNLRLVESAISKINIKEEVKSNKKIQKSFEKLYND